MGRRGKKEQNLHKSRNLAQEKRKSGIDDENVCPNSNGVCCGNPKPKREKRSCDNNKVHPSIDGLVGKYRAAHAEVYGLHGGANRRASDPESVHVLSYAALKAQTKFQGRTGMASGVLKAFKRLLLQESCEDDEFELAWDSLHSFNLISRRVRARIFEKMMEQPENSSALWHYIQQSNTRKKLKLAEVTDCQLDLLLAGAMKGEAHLSDTQYKVVARYVNLKVPPFIKFTTGGIVPGLERVQNELISSGMRLPYSAVERIYLQPEGYIIDLCDSSDDEDTERCDTTLKQESGVKCVYVKDPMTTLVKPEVEDVLNLFPSCGQQILCPTASLWKEAGTAAIDFVLHVDNTALQTFTGATHAYECCVIRMILPGQSTAQQQHFSCIPLFVFEGGEKYEYIQAMFAKLLGESSDAGLLKDHIEVCTESGKQHRIRVHWHLCSDMKLILIVLGLRAGGTYPCFMCPWRSKEAMAGPWPKRKPPAVMDCVLQTFMGVLDIDSQLGKLNSTSAKDSDQTAQQRRDIRSALRERRAREIQSAIHEIQHDARKGQGVVAALNDACILQDEGMHIAREHCMAYAVVQVCQEIRDKKHTQHLDAAQREQDALAAVLTAGSTTATAPHIASFSDLTRATAAAEQEVSEAEASLDAAWKQLRELETRVNSQLNMVVLYPTESPECISHGLPPLQEARESTLAPTMVSLNVVEGADLQEPVLAQFYRPTLGPEHVTVKLFTELIQQVLCGMKRANLVQARIPARNIHPEVMHLKMNNINHLADVVEHAFQYLLQSDGQPRDLTAVGNRPNEWQVPKSFHSTRHPVEWVRKGADFNAVVRDVLGMGKPITGRTGGQCSKLVSEVYKIWIKFKDVLAASSESLSGPQEQLEVDLDCDLEGCAPQHIPYYLETALEACRVCCTEISGANPDLALLSHYVAQYTESVCFFSHKNMFAPLRYSVKTYDHILRWHILPIARDMDSDQALSLGVLSSGALEALNKVFKVHVRQNVGGGRLDTTHELSNDSLVRCFIRMSADLRCMGRRWYSVAEARTVCSNGADSRQ